MSQKNREPVFYWDNVGQSDNAVTKQVSWGPLVKVYSRKTTNHELSFKELYLCEFTSEEPSK